MKRRRHNQQAAQSYLNMAAIANPNGQFNNLYMALIFARANRNPPPRAAAARLPCRASRRYDAIR
jgi:hypothetical protein